MEGSSDERPRVDIDGTDSSGRHFVKHHPPKVRTDPSQENLFLSNCRYPALRHLFRNHPLSRVANALLPGIHSRGQHQECSNRQQNRRGQDGTLRPQLRPLTCHDLKTRSP